MHFLRSPRSADLTYSKWQGYVEAAQIFERESGTQADTDLSAITDRTEIRKAVQSGNVEEAIDRVNDLNPEVGPISCKSHLLTLRNTTHSGHSSYLLQD